MQGLLEFRLIRTYVPTAFDRLAAADLFICWVRNQVTLQPAAGEDRAGAAILCGSGPRHVPSPGAGGRRGHRCREGVALDHLLRMGRAGPALAAPPPADRLPPPRPRLPSP